MKSRQFFISITYAVSILLLVITFYIGTKYNIPFETITGDPLSTFSTHPFTGAISNIGVLLWCVTCSICIFAGIILSNNNNNNNNNHKKESVFLFSSGILTIILLIDDLFMFHDYLFYSFKQFKITQPITYSIYGILVIWYVYSFFKTIFSTRYIILGIAFFFLGMSIVTDLFIKNEGLTYFIEDGLKFIGITSWMLYFTTTSYQLLSKKH